MLWELGNSAPGTSEALLRLLLDAGRFAGGGSALAAALAALQPQLLPLFATGMAPKAAASGGPAASGKVMNVLVGPLARLPPALQCLAVDCLAFAPRYDPQLLRTVALMAHTTAYSQVCGSSACRC